MHLFLDTEFNGFKGELISMALVPEDDNYHPWYEVKEREDTRVIDPWVAMNVTPKLNKAPLRPWLFRESFQRYISQFDNPIIVCDWYTDAAHFCEYLNGPTHMSSYGFEFTLEVVLHTGTNLEPEIPHNALSDAIALKKWYMENHLLVLMGRNDENIILQNGVDHEGLNEFARET